ncbi:unnamed protein product [Thlaspi arvense]|uniref:Reverse transcriptase zinc-binding domain-containing protein n=1 Tax=Thlaspi arvense TaxID=13288 RepID=A0AAU9RMT7_THLAR|nr:unnamed protein product [Thlaspi arvense]
METNKEIKLFVSKKVSWHEAVWFKGHIPKYAFNFWVANKCRLPLCTRLLKWGIGSSDACCMCNLHEETRDHLFLQCEVSIQVLKLLLTRLGEPSKTFASWPHFIDWILGPSPHTPKIIKLLASQTVIYFLWKERNLRLHENVSSTLNLIFRLFDRSIREAIHTQNRTQSTDLLSSWFRHAN